MDLILNELERRVLGVLLEKSMTQPEYYPMTANAIVAGCNQKSNRDPVMELDEVAVLATLDYLRKRGLIEQILPAPGARTDRFKHKIEARFGWPQRERAIITELLLRGPQTVGELRTHGSRMASFESLDIVANVLKTLGECDPPVVSMMPREPGQSAVRYMHLFYPEGEAPAPSAATAPPAPRSLAVTSSQATAPPRTPDDDVEALHSQIEDLHAEVADLHEELAKLRHRLDDLERQIIH